MRSIRSQWLVATSVFVLGFSACTRSEKPAASSGVAPVTGPAGSPGEAAGRCSWARGWAAETQGGRGGQIVKVTTLAASGLGSLAEALAASGPRIIVFE